MTLDSSHGGDSAGRVFQRLDLCVASPYTRLEYAKRFAWKWVECLLSLVWLPRRLRVKKRLLRMFGADVAGHVDRGARVWHPWLLRLGKLSILADQVNVYNLARIEVGEHTVVSQGVYLCAGTHDYEDRAMPLIRDERASIVIGDGVWICAGAFIGPGVRVGDNSIVGAKAVVTKDVPAGVVVAGNPAKVIKQRAMIDG